MPYHSQVSGLLLFIESSLCFKVEKLKQISSTDSFKVEVEVVEIVTYATAKYLSLQSNKLVNQYIGMDTYKLGSPYIYSMPVSGSLI
jgi:hypothetical protein